MYHHAQRFKRSQILQRISLEIKCIHVINTTLITPFASTRSAGCSQPDGTMDSHLHAVSGVSSCSQRSQVESNKQSRTRLNCGSQARRVINKKRGYRIGKPSDASISASYAGPKLASISQWTWYRLLTRQDTPSLHAF